MQVNRASGAFMMSQRRQSMSMQIPGSPLPPALSASGRLASGVLDTFSSLASDENRDVGVEVELAEDEEFAAEEHAHRCVLVCCTREPVYLTRELRCCMLPGVYMAPLTFTGSGFL